MGLVAPDPWGELLIGFTLICSGSRSCSAAEGIKRAESRSTLQYRQPGWVQMGSNHVKVNVGILLENYAMYSKHRSVQSEGVLGCFTLDCEHLL